MERLIHPPAWTFPIATIVEDNVLDFAKHHGLQLKTWHQNEPLWYIFRDVARLDWTVTHFVQLGIFRRDEEEPRIKAIPGARMVNERLGKAWVLKSTPESFSMLIPRVGEGISGVLKSLLDDAWEKAQTLDPADIELFTEEELPSRLGR